MIYCQVKDGVVVNRAVFDEPMPNDWPDRDSWIENEEAQIDWTYSDGVWTAPPPPPPSETKPAGPPLAKKPGA